MKVLSLDDERRILSKQANPRPGLTALMIVVSCLPVLGMYFLSFRHYSVTRRMGWQCTGIVNTANPKFPHIEDAKFWFIDNPHYEERASGPRLCTELRASHQAEADMTFDVWGNRFIGLKGYDTTGISVRGKQLELYGSESGGFHDPGPFYANFNSYRDQKLHPEKYRFPLDIFK